jgi:hypothetical protein
VDTRRLVRIRFMVGRACKGALFLATLIGCASGGDGDFNFDEAGASDVVGDFATRGDSAGEHDSGAVDAGSPLDSPGGDDPDVDPGSPFDAALDGDGAGTAGEDGSGGSPDSEGGGGDSGGSTCGATTCASGCCQGSTCVAPLASTFHVCATAVGGASCQDCAGNAHSSECFCGSNLCVCL